MVDPSKRLLSCHQKQEITPYQEHRFVHKMSPAAVLIRVGFMTPVTGRC